MFKMKVRIAVEHQLEGRCAKHIRYNPVKDELAGIKHGCNACYELLHAYRAYLTLLKQIEAFETTVETFIVKTKAPRSRSRRVPNALPDATLREVR